jgi:hypothetical protein
VPEAAPLLALIVVFPAAIAVISPVADTLATDGALLLHVTGDVVLTVPNWSVTLAVA